MEGSDWIALAAVVSSAVVAVFSLMGQHRTTMAKYRYEQRQQAYIDYIKWFEEPFPDTEQLRPPAEMKARLMAWGSAAVIELSRKGWTPETAVDLDEKIGRNSWRGGVPHRMGSVSGYVV